MIVRKRYLGWFITSVCLLFMSCSRPLAGFNLVQDGAAVAPARYGFLNTSTKADSYIWDFGDGTRSTEVNPQHSYFLSGRYLVSLTSSKGSKNHVFTQEIFIDAPQSCLVMLETNLGTMTLELFDDTPLHRDNFEKLAEQAYYDGLLFHRVIRNFMVQTGDPESRNAPPDKRLGAGGPDYTLEPEMNGLHYHVRGALAAARLSDDVNPEKESSGSQFYIVHGRPIGVDQLEIIERQKRIRYPQDVMQTYIKEGGAPQLDGEYTVFGRLVSGQEILDKIAASVTDGNDRPRPDVKILKATVIK